METRETTIVNFSPQEYNEHLEALAQQYEDELDAFAELCEKELEEHDAYGSGGPFTSRFNI